MLHFLYFLRLTSAYDSQGDCPLADFENECSQDLKASLTQALQCKKLDPASAEIPQHFFLIQISASFGSFNVYDMRSKCTDRWVVTPTFQICTFSRIDINTASAPRRTEKKLSFLKFTVNMLMGSQSIEMKGTFRAIHTALKFSMYYKPAANQNSQRLRNRTYNTASSRTNPYEELVTSLSVQEDCIVDGDYRFLANNAQLLHIVDVNDTPQLSHPQEIYPGWNCSTSPCGRSYYRSNCTDVCGNGIKTISEGCDDGNTAAGDGCSAVCSVECGYNCTAVTPNPCSTRCGDSKLAGEFLKCQARMDLPCGWSNCTEVCGDGIKTTSEGCDDGKTAAGDGCSAAVGRLSVPIMKTNCSVIARKPFNYAEPSIWKYVDQTAPTHDFIFASSVGFLKLDGRPGMRKAVYLSFDIDFRAVKTALAYENVKFVFSMFKHDCYDIAADKGVNAGEGTTWRLGCQSSGSFPVSLVPCVISGGQEFTYNLHEAVKGKQIGMMSFTARRSEWLYTELDSQTVREELKCGKTLCLRLDPVAAVNEPLRFLAPATTTAARKSATEENFLARLEIHMGAPVNISFFPLRPQGVSKQTSQCFYIIQGCSLGECTVECGYNCTAAQPNVCSTRCGDSKLAGNETCDDGNTISGDGCSANCSNVEPGWTCSTQPCGRSNCTQVCGDGIKTTSEGCDDGSTAAGDGCSGGCTVECGYNCTAAQPNVCSVTCGDSKLAGNEQCDDGNSISGDGCSADCSSVEAGWSCPPLACGRSSCTQVCGNGIKTSSEACDDGNTAAGDGCSAVCSVECGYTCAGQPSVCYASAAVYVEMTLRLPLEKAFFTATALRQLSFHLAVAATARVPEENVTIAAMEEVAASRRAVSLDIITQIRVNDDAAATRLLSSWSTITLNMYLKSAGLPDAILMSLTVKNRPTDTVEDRTKQVLQSNVSLQPGAIRADEATKAVAASSILGAVVGGATIFLCSLSAASYFFRRRYSISTSNHANSHLPPITDVVNITTCHTLAPQHVSERDHMRYNVDGRVGFGCSGNFNDATNLRKEDLEEKLSTLLEVDVQLGFVVAV